MIRIRIADDWMAGGIAIAIVMEPPAESVIDPIRQIARVDGSYVRFEPFDPMVMGDPTLRLRDEIARPLLDALLRYYQGASDMHTARSDLLHERGRVDKLTDAVIELAKGLSE